MLYPIDDESRFLATVARAALGGAAAAAALHLLRATLPPSALADAAAAALVALAFAAAHRARNPAREPEGALAAAAAAAAFAGAAALFARRYPLLALAVEGVALGSYYAAELAEGRRAMAVRAGVALALLAGAAVKTYLQAGLVGLAPPAVGAALSGAGLGLLVGIGTAPAFFRLALSAAERRCTALRRGLAPAERATLDRALASYRRALDALAEAPSLEREERLEILSTLDDLLARAETPQCLAALERLEGALARCGAPSASGGSDLARRAESLGRQLDALSGPEPGA